MSHCYYLIPTTSFVLDSVVVSIKVVVVGGVVLDVLVVVEDIVVVGVGAENVDKNILLS